MKMIVPIFFLSALISVIIFIAKRKHTYVLGSEMANAYNLEQKRIKDGCYGQSPMPEVTYESFPDEKHLYKPIKNYLDDSLISVVNAYSNSDEKAKNDIRKSISMDEIYTLLLFSKRCVLFALHKNDTSYIDYAAGAISMIEAERCDFRDILTSLSLINYGGEILKIGINDILQNVSKKSDKNTSELILDFTKRSKTEKDIRESWGFYPIETQNGIGFLHTEFEPYNPKKPLHNTLLTISEIIALDKYGAGDISVGTEIAGIWLSSKNEDEFSKEFKDLLGCASLHSNAKDEKNNMLLVYIAEFSDPKSIEAIYTATIDRNKKGFSRLLIKHENILSIVIARSTMQGVNSIETDESLKRFEIPIKKALRKLNEVH